MSGLQFFHIDIKGLGSPSVNDYSDGGLRERVISPDELLIKDEKITITFEYPWLRPSIKFEYTSEGGFTRIQLFKYVFEGYQRIYDEHEVEIDGKSYGIAGCHLSDLIIETITYDPERNNVFMAIKF